MTKKFDLFLLMFSISQVRDRRLAVKLLCESLSELYQPIVFYYSEQKRDGVAFEEGIRTRKSSFGYIYSENLPAKKQLPLVQNAVQMLAIFLERLKFEKELSDKMNSVEQLADSRLEQINRTMEELEQARLASLNLVEDLTEEARVREQAQKALAESEEKYRLLFENMLNGFAYHQIVTDETGKAIDYVFMEVNDAFEEMTGLQKENIIGKKVTEAIPGIENDPADWIGKYGEVALVGKELRIEQYAEPLSKWYSVYAFSPKIGYFATIFEDITERKRAEIALRESEARFQTLAESSPVGIFLDDTQGNCIYVNPTCAELVGLSPEECLSFNWVPSIHPDDRERVTNEWAKSVEQGTTFQQEYRWVHSDGSIVSTLGLVSPVKGPDGSVAHYVGTLIDLTDRKRAEQALQRYSERLEVLRTIDRAILAAESSEAIVQAALGHIRKLVPCRRASVALIPEGEAMAVVLAAQVNGETQYGSGRRVPLEAFGLSEDLKPGEIRRVDDLAKYESKIPMHERLLEEGILSFINVPILAQGELLGMLNVGADRVAAFTDEDLEILREVADQLGVALQQARLHEQLQRHAQELELRVAERTRELEASNKALEDFAYSVSHDLRAPLRAISGFAEIISSRHRESLHEEGRHYFDNILEAAGHMGELIQDLLDFSRLGKGVKDFQPIPLTTLTEKIVAELQAGGTASGVWITVEPDLPTVLGTPTLLRQVFSNLIGNALKFRRDGVEHRVNVRGFKEGPWAVIEVEDNGIGIAPKYLDKIFNIFQRLHSQDNYPGTGIGLAIVKKAVTLMDGTVKVESEPGKGSLFRVKLKKVE